MPQKAEPKQLSQAELIHELAKKCLERLDTTKVKGKKTRTDKAIEFAAGAAQAIEVLGLDYNLTMHFFLICTRGIEEVERAAHPDFVKDKGTSPEGSIAPGIDPQTKMKAGDWGLNQAHG